MNYVYRQQAEAYWDSRPVWRRAAKGHIGYVPDRCRSCGVRHDPDDEYRRTKSADELAWGAAQSRRRAQQRQQHLTDELEAVEFLGSRKEV